MEDRHNPHDPRHEPPLTGDSPDRDGDARSLLRRGVEAFRAGDAGASEAAFLQALGVGMHAVSQSCKNLASICYRGQRYQEAVDYIVRYREDLPYERDPLLLHVSSLVELDRFGDAERELNRFLEVFPGDTEVLAALLYCFGLQDRFLELLAYSARVPTAALNHPKIVRAIAGALSALGLRQAAGHMIEASVLSTEQLSADERAEAERLARFLGADRALEEHRFADAIGLYQSSIEGGDVNVGLFNLSLALLSAGRLGDGWRLMRARADLFPSARIAGIPCWAGESLQGKCILVHSEQGLGDVIQFVRYLPLLERSGVRVAFNAYPQILHLLRNDPNASALTSPSPDLSRLPFDYQAQLLDLPAMLGTETVADIPAQVPYLFSSPERRAFWRNRLAGVDGLKIGLVWSGNPKHKQDQHRSARLDDFAALAILPGVTWVLLQKGCGEQEGLAPPEGMAVVRLSGEIGDFDDTASIIEELDLLISVDTSVAHLAGALGRPVWILLAEAGKDWRWFLDGERSPWYPSARLFTRGRQTSWADFIRDSLRPVLVRWWSSKLRRDESWAAACSLLDGFAAVPTTSGESHVWQTALAVHGTCLLPWARAAMLELNDAAPLAALYQRCPASTAVASAWAEWLLLQGQCEGAWALWLELAETGHIPPSGFNAWGGSLHDQARYDEARAVWRKALSAYPDHSYLHYMAGRTEQWSGGRETAVICYERALSLSPRLAVAHNNRGVLHEHDEPLKALAAYQRALLFDCTYAKPWQNAARVLLRLRAGYAAAVLMRERCASDRSAASAARIALTRALLLSGDEAAARDLLQKIVSAGSAIVDHDELCDMSLLYSELGDFRQCKAMLERLLELSPSSRSGRFFYGWRLLAEGRCDEGWSYYADGCDRKATVIPEWQGEVLGGKTLLVFQDQGMGDLFQFLHRVCVIPDAQITLAVCDPVLSFVQYQNFPFKVIAVSSVDWQSASYDFQIAFMKLPKHLGADLLDPPATPPYLKAPTGMLPQWERKCASDARFKVGIVWAGNPKYLNDTNRSTLLRDWLPLFDVAGVGIYSLQKDTASNQALAWNDLEIQNIAVDCDSWEKTANALALLDLVVSVDTGVAHLAAGLGIPVWILLPNRGTDFRWLIDREDVPWYPQARLFRQQKNESWADVIMRVRKQLAERVAGLRSRD